MNGYSVKSFGVRSFMINGLTAKWGIGDSRPPLPPDLMSAMVCWYDTRKQGAQNIDVIESYAEDFTSSKWTLTPAANTTTRTAKSLNMTNVIANGAILTGNTSNAMTVRVQGMTGNGLVMSYLYGHGASEYVLIRSNGIYNLPASSVPDAGFRTGGYTGACNITVEQLPTSVLEDFSGRNRPLYLYGYNGTAARGVNAEGWLVSDGVGTVGVSYSKPVLADYTVIARRVWDTVGVMPEMWFAGSRVRNVTEGEFTIEKKWGSLTRSFGLSTVVTTEPSEVTYQTTTSYNGQTIPKGAAQGNTQLAVGAGSLGDPAQFKGKWCSFLLFDRTLTATELDYVKRYMV